MELRRALNQCARDYPIQQLQLPSLPKIKFELSVNADEQPTFGRYINGEHTIHLAVEDLHVVDIIRTLAHELVHFKQDLKGDLDGPGDPGATGSPQENEANAEAAVIMRNWGKKHPELFEKEAIG